MLSHAVGDECARSVPREGSRLYGTRDGERRRFPEPTGAQQKAERGF